MAIGTAAAIIGATALSAGIGAISSSNASSAQARAAERQAQAIESTSAEAAKVQREGTRDSIAAQMAMYLQGREDMAPWKESGQAALNQLLGRNIAPSRDLITQTPGAQPAPTQPQFDGSDPQVQALVNQWGMSPQDAYMAVYGTPPPAPQAQQNALQAQFAPRAEADYGPINTEFTQPQTFSPGAEFTRPNTFNPGAEFTTANTFNPSRDLRESNTFNPGSEFSNPFRLSAEELYADPGYQFRKSEGENALERLGAARGYTSSGRELREAARYASDLASQEYGAAYERGSSDLARRYGVAADVYNSDVADTARRYGIEADIYNSSVADLSRRYGVQSDIYNTNTADLSRRYGVGLDTYNAATQDRDRRQNFLTTLAGYGQNASTQLASQAQNTGAGIAGAYGTQGSNLAQIAGNRGNNLATIYGQQGQNQANAALGMGAGINNAIQGGVGSWLSYQNMNSQNALLQSLLK